MSEKVIAAESKHTHTLSHSLTYANSPGYYSVVSGIITHQSFMKLSHTHIDGTKTGFGGRFLVFLALLGGL